MLGVVGAEIYSRLEERQDSRTEPPGQRKPDFGLRRIGVGFQGLADEVLPAIIEPSPYLATRFSRTKLYR